MSLSQETDQLVPGAKAPSPDAGASVRRSRAVINWVLALLTVPAAILVMIFAVGAAMSFAACSAAQCPHLGPSGLVYGILFYGAPVVAAVTIIVSFFTALRRWGFIVPLFGLVLLLADVAVTALLFRT
ncbi:hypothetical protein AWC27_13205 [Mycobacterium szulgai]|uniref:Uncharacterized protein n=1 Tax=Mycobacterium szulgai TaxID=1787 RepID=A0A1X2DLG8_MYCSZ|nr:hypothetical protein [Mycobacterium szulgai]MCV7077553.1 hypothetical protein [Mycobacterium szulgai]ORW89035.1 hypothetical protein AWC27_13205 [Mycobacterium szulgai]